MEEGEVLIKRHYNYN